MDGSIIGNPILLAHCQYRAGVEERFNHADGQPQGLDRKFTVIGRKCSLPLVNVIRRAMVSEISLSGIQQCFK